MKRPSKAKADSAFQLLTEADPDVTALTGHFFSAADEAEVNAAIVAIDEALDGVSNRAACVALVSILADFVDEFGHDDSLPKDADPTMFLKMVRCALFGQVIMRWQDREASRA